MRGESASSAQLLPQGLEGDRAFALASTAAPHGKPLLSSAERTAALHYTACWQPAPLVLIPAGDRLPLPSPGLLAVLQRDLAAPGAQLSLERSPENPFFDVRPVSLISRATLQALEQGFGQQLDPLRFRSNLILSLEGAEPFAEESWAGRVLRFGDPDGPALRLLERIPRCRMVSLNPETVAADPTLLRYLAQQRRGRAGMYARVEQPGMLHAGDAVWLDRQTQ